LLLMTPFGLYQAWGFDFAAVRPGTWLLLLFYSLAASVWSVWLWMTGLRHVPAALGGVFTVMLPVTAALVGVLVLGEPFGGLQALAFALALAGVLLATAPAAFSADPGPGAAPGHLPDRRLDVLAARRQHGPRSRAACSARCWSTSRSAGRTLVTTASRCSTSMTAISRIQLSSPVTLKALMTSGVCSISFTTRAYSTRPTRTMARMP
jgi:hypothetical protein